MVSTLSSSREECYGHPSFCNYKNPDVNISRSKLKVFCLTGYCSSGERVSLLTLKFGSGNRAGLHCIKSVRTRSVSGLYFPEFGLNTEIYRANLHIQSECGKIKTRKTPNKGTFYAVPCIIILTSLHFLTTLVKYILLERAGVRILLSCAHRQTPQVNIHICVHTSLYTDIHISQSASLETSELLLLR